jgi:hypothetical protein
MYNPKYLTDQEREQDKHKNSKKPAVRVTKKH